MLSITPFGGHVLRDVQDVPPDRPIRRRGDTRVDRRPSVPERFRP